MGAIWCYFFGEKDTVLIEEIAKTHKFKKEVVERHYKKMLNDIKDELQD